MLLRQSKIKKTQYYLAILTWNRPARIISSSACLLNIPENNYSMRFLEQVMSIKQNCSTNGTVVVVTDQIVNTFDM